MNRVTVDPAHRGHGFGPLLVAEALHELSAGLAMAACEPAPFELDRDSDPAAWDAERSRLRRLWTAFGFAQFADTTLWTLDLGITRFTDAIARSRSRVLKP